MKTKTIFTLKEMEAEKTWNFWEGVLVGFIIFGIITFIIPLIFSTLCSL